MSVTTTATTVGPQALLSTLGDYELHHSGDVGSPESRALPPNPHPRPDALSESDAARANPAGWPTEYRAIPPHRPINRNLDMEQRPAGMNPVEQIFIAVLLHGTAVVASASQLWAKTGARIVGKNSFLYEIGGEW